ncbi:TraR/DksA C4-type zinc finger protein [Magnetospirillum fulvum]|uniref:Conjugal transfer protein TraR n=1 Tax=Magnetospirillum fulvum MGU-K5 TaxID=1316936 RepID=S9TQT2_MAGFU|nr:TraR/DksA C4-type zinc finger protein [Magnetospirillum fulvum]EPY00920.1 conjugal transfer protein TraR [Magnetospirillum fulvum MGU-K5]
MADTIDKAQEVAEMHRLAALSRLPPTPSPRPVSAECEECGETITEARRRAVPHTTLCADCAAEAEAQARRRSLTGGH